MAKKAIRDITFKEFVDWANKRAADGQWSLNTAMTSTLVISEIYNIKKLFGTNKAREKAWEEKKPNYFKLDAEIDVE